MTKNTGLYVLIGALIVVAAIAAAVIVALPSHHHHEATDSNMTECERQGEEMAMNDSHHNHTAHLIACGVDPETAANATAHEDNMTPDNSTGNMTGMS